MRRFLIALRRGQEAEQAEFSPPFARVAPRALPARKVPEAPLRVPGLAAAAGRSPLLIGEGADPAVAEQHRMLRTRLLHYQGGRPLRSVLVTSSLPGEGKSIVAANLAIAVASSVRERALLVDCDLRRPSLHRLLGLRPSQGLADCLRHGIEAGGLLLATHVGKLSLLPGGTPAPDAAELLASQRMRDLLEELTSRYDDRLVVLDAGPMLTTTDPALLAAQADGVLLVVRSGLARCEQVRRAVEAIMPEKFLGVVFNGLEPSGGF